MGRTVTITLPDTLLEQSEKLVESGYFSDIEDVVNAGVKHLVHEWTPTLEDGAPPRGPDRFRFYLNKLRRDIAAAGGLFPGKTKEEIIEIMRQTRQEIYEEEYADYFRR
jgi:hypothetical protein